MNVGAPPPNTEPELEQRLSEPPPFVLDALGRVRGDVLVLGAAGKMGPSLARMVRRALDTLHRDDRVLAVSRFSDPGIETALRTARVETIRCDLADRRAVDALPDAPNVVFMAGQKFGTAAEPATTWAMNTVVPMLCADRYAGSRIVAFSTGNVYPLAPADRGGSVETDAPGPVGEYASSCLGRERIFEWLAARNGTPVALVRLNYAIELRYGVLVDLARAVLRGDPIDVAMGYVNVIWQSDACAQAVACLPHAATPPFVINVTGTDVLSVRALAQRFGELLGRTPRIVGEEAPDALLSNSARAAELFGPPGTSVGQMMVWIADWLSRGGRVLDKPTHFQEREGRF